MSSTSNVGLRLAATTIPLRATGQGTEILMVRRGESLSFGGMWTFPGGVIEQSDGPTPDLEGIDEDTFDWGAPRLLATAANAANRETREETNLSCPTPGLSWFSHWIPPANIAKRFATWFFLAPETSGDLQVDGTENTDARWITPAQALAGYTEGDFPMAAPTWCTVNDLAQVASIPALIDRTITQGPVMHHTRAFPTGQGRMLCWVGDSAYDSGDLEADGPRNRMLVDENFAVLERTRSS